MVKDSARSYLCRVFGAEGIPGHLVDTRLVFSFKNHEYFSPSAKRGADGKIAWNHSFVINMEQPLDSYINNMRRPEIEIRLQDTKRHSLMRREASSLDLGLSRSRSGRRSIDRESDGSVSSPWTTRSKTPKPGMSHSVGDRGERVASSGIATAVCSGTFLIKQVTESKNDKIFWVDLLDSKGGSCGRLAVGWFRTIVRTPTENRAVRKKKWFEKKADKESRQMEKKIDRLIDFIFGGDTLKKLKPVVQNATGAEAEAKVMYELMRIVKTQEGREQFVYKLDPSRLPAKAAKRIGSCIAIQSRRTFEFLSVLVKAALREGVYTRDFQLNKVLMDVSYFYHYFDKEKKAHMFLYLEIAHEQTYSQSLEFWESAFVSSEQVVNPIVEDDTTSEIYKREVAESCKMRVIDLVDVFLAQMTIFSDVSSPKTLGLADKMCFMFDISEESIKNLHKEVEEREEFRDIFETPATRPKKESKLELRKKGKHAVKHSMADVQVKLGGILQQSQWVRYRTDAGLFFHNRETNQISDFPPPHSIFEDSTIAGKQVHVTKSSSEYLFREVKLGVIGECWMQTRVGQTASWQQNMGKYRSIQGTMVVTNYRVEFNSFEGEPWMNEMIPVHAMDRFELDVFTVTTAVGQKEMQVMVFHTKDYRTLKVTAAFSKDLAKLLKRIKKLAFPKSVTGLFAFTFRQPVAHADDGWQIFDVEREMARQGALEAGWRICDINKDFTFSPTYPQRLVMPDFVKDQDLPAMAKFRSKKRMPALTYYLARKKVSMLRSSQPMVGLTGNRGKEEEWMLQELRLTSIFDARPTENAFANKAKGGGYEDPRFYTRRGDAKCEIHFCDIHNIHRMRSSLAQVTIACESQLVRRSDEYWDLILKSKWVAHVRNMVMQSYRLAQTMLDGETVLVHCSDGWDRTAQMCCLAQVCLDRYFRTIEGLSVLIEKDWCSFGHQFHKRIGHGSSKFSDSDRSPIFVQFLDGLWQMWKQAPDRFEYNERIFEYLAEEVVACKFGTFLFDNERQRVEHQLKQRTVSVWTYVCKTNKADFLNPLYQPNLDMPQVANMSLSKSRKNLHSGDQENKDCEFLQLNMDPRLFEVWPYYYRQDAHLIRNFRGTGKYNGRPRNSEPGWIGEHILSLVKAKGKLQIDWLSNRVTDLERKLKEAEQKLTTHRREEAKKDHLHKTPPRLKNATSQDSWRDKSTQPTIVSTKSVASTTPSIPFPRTITQTSVASSTMAVQDVDCSNSITSPNNLSAEEEEKEKEKKQQPGASSSPTPTTPSPHDTKSEAGAPLPGARRRIVDRRPNHTYPIPPVGPGQDAPPLEARWRAPSNNHRPGQQQKQQQPRSQTEAAIMAAALAMQKKRRAKPGGGGGGGDKGQGSPSTSRGTTKQKKAFSLPGVERQHHPHPGPPPATNSHWRRQRQQQRQEKHQKKQFGFNSTAPPPVVDAQKSKEAAAPEGAATPPTGRRTPPPFRKKKIRAKSKAKEETTTATGKRTVRNGKGASKARKFFVALQQRQQKPQGGGGEAAPPPRKPPVASHAHSHSAAAAGSCASSSPKPRPCHRPVYSQMPHLSSDAPPPPPPEEEEEQEGGARKIHVRQYQLKSQTKMVKTKRRGGRKCRTEDEETPPTHNRNAKYEILKCIDIIFHKRIKLCVVLG
mmetsp:Transcript_33884/g.82153  ORF Transcript_33884/g.82153 Transcript_33884/m.82153 type:complete len:1647 (-) Transcript_33884:1494-6434(-)